MHDSKQKKHSHAQFHTEKACPPRFYIERCHAQFHTEKYKYQRLHTRTNQANMAHAEATKSKSIIFRSATTRFFEVRLG